MTATSPAGSGRGFFLSLSVPHRGDETMPEPPKRPPNDILIRALEPADIPDLTEAWNQPLAIAS